MTDLASIVQHYPEMNGVHPAADLFPMMDAVEFAELCKSISESGLEQPVTLNKDGLLLDGRNRLLACYEVQQEVLFDYYEGNDPWGFSLRLNMLRRHLTAGQKAAIALELEKEYAKEAKPGRPSQVDIEQAAQQAAADVGKKNLGRSAQVSPDANRPREKAAKAVGVSGRSVQQLSHHRAMHRFWTRPRPTLDQSKADPDNNRSANPHHDWGRWHTPACVPVYEAGGLHVVSPGPGDQSHGPPSCGSTHCHALSCAQQHSTQQLSAAVIGQQQPSG